MDKKKGTLDDFVIKKSSDTKKRKAEPIEEADFSVPNQIVKTFLFIRKK